MKMTKKVFSLSFALICFFCQNLFCQTYQNSASIANRRTAIRYLQLAKQNFSDKKWNEAESASKIGLAYDDSIADLWYINAAAKMNRGDKKSEVLSLVSKSLSGGGDWVDYNRDGARILYADLLCSTRKFSEAVSVLDQNPFIYSSDAEFIRAKAYYNERTSESIEKARLKIDAARRVYPKDWRFPRLFYSFEYALLNENSGDENFKADELVQKIADSFFASISNYSKSDAEIELLSSFFVENPEQKLRSVKAFNARGEKSPLYPALALEFGLIDERAALDYFYGFSDKSVFLPVLRQFIKSIKDGENKKELCEYLNSYSGTLLIDTDGDLAANMTVKYERGRPMSISYDADEDDENDWSCECDFGVPLNLSLASPPLKIAYENWPFIRQVGYNLSSENSSLGNLSFDIVADSLAWCPFSIEAEQTARKELGIDFFIPAIDNSKNLALSAEKIIESAMSCTVPSKERKNASVTVALLNGLAQEAVYSADGKTYAVAKFENGLPVNRLVDMDGDGIFETAEEYGASADLNENFISKDDEMQNITNLFALSGSHPGIYLKSITIDKNGDTIPDFMEEYTAGGGKISSWDSNSDGKWDIRYVKLPSQDGKIHEQSMFYEPLKNKIVTVESVDGVPVDVKSGGENLSVFKGENENFYWLSEKNEAAASKSFSEQKIIEKVNHIDSQGVCIIVEDESERFIAVRIEGKIFAEKLPSATVNNDEKN